MHSVFGEPGRQTPFEIEARAPQGAFDKAHVTAAGVQFEAG